MYNILSNKWFVVAYVIYFLTGVLDSHLSGADSFETLTFYSKSVFVVSLTVLAVGFYFLWFKRN